ncbi:hypothetical protein EV356DRAFT_569416 [Viridothelium virens]|uniref:Paf1-domain-containing protein n=1 Tax=Viridothelium virens TaxID=1048519 RepID=A0A6A6H1D0_VIRVR|nr:hypothetical protein EV356DRAFT_569416 [Viridothelium virens]
MSNSRSRPAYSTFLTNSPEPLNVDRSDLFFRVEFTDADTSAKLTPVNLSLRTPYPSITDFDADFDEGDAASIDTPTLIRNSEGRVGYESCTADGIMYAQNKQSSKRDPSAKGRTNADSSNPLPDALGPFKPETLDGDPARLMREGSIAAALGPDPRDALWFVPQPANLARVRKTPLYTLEANAANRISQDLQFFEIRYYLNPWNAFGGMDKYYAEKYGSASVKDPFVQGWLRAMEAVPAPADVPVSENNTPTTRKEEDSTGDDVRLLSLEEYHPTNSLESGEVGEAILDKAPSLLYNPDNRTLGEPSRTKPIAALQSMRRGRPLPKLSLDTDQRPVEAGDREWEWKMQYHS